MALDIKAALLSICLLCNVIFLVMATVQSPMNYVPISTKITMGPILEVMSDSDILSLQDISPDEIHVERVEIVEIISPSMPSENRFSMPHHVVYSNLLQ